MQSNCSITRITPAGRPAIHSYYDVCPESPDGSRLVFTQFTQGTVPGPARPMIAAIDGDDPTPLAEPGDAIGHVGRYPMWLGDDRVAYKAGSLEETAGWFTHDLATGASPHHPGGLRQFHTGVGRGTVQLVTQDDNPHGMRNAIGVVDDHGREVGRFTTADARAAHPDPDTLPPVETLNMMNAKWSPDGSRFFAVFTDEIYRKRLTDPPPKFKCLVVADPDGQNVRFLSDFTHHPGWSPDGKDAIAMLARTEGATQGPAQTGDQDLVAYDADTGVKRTLLERVAGVHGTITPDGRWFIIDEFNSPAKGQGTIVRWDLQTAQREVLVTFNHTAWSHGNGHHPHPVLSRDGSAIYFNAMDDSVCQVYCLTLPA